MPCFYRKMSAKIFENNNRFSHLSVLNLWANTIYFTQNVRNYVKTMVFYTLNFFDLQYRSAPFSKMFFTLTCGELFSFTRSVFLGAFILPKTFLDSITSFHFSSPTLKNNAEIKNNVPTKEYKTFHSMKCLPQKIKTTSFVFFLDDLDVCQWPKRKHWYSNVLFNLFPEVDSKELRLLTPFFSTISQEQKN